MRWCGAWPPSSRHSLLAAGSLYFSTARRSFTLRWRSSLSRQARSSAQDILPPLILQQEPLHFQVSRRRVPHPVQSQHVESELKFEATSRNGEQLQSLGLCFLGRLGEVA